MSRPRRSWKDRWWYPAWPMFALIGLLIVVSLFLTLVFDPTATTPAKPAPVVHVVTLPNGQPVTCIVLEHSVTCDWLSWASGKATKP